MANKSFTKEKLSKLLCIFCYKPIKDSHDPENSNRVIIDTDTTMGSSTSSISHAQKLEICDKFYNQLLYPLNPFEEKKKKKDLTSRVGVEEESEDDECSVVKHNIATEWDPEKSNICADCFYAVSTHTKLFEKVGKLQRRLKWQLDKLYNVMDAANKISSRVKEFQDTLKGNKDEDSVKKYRETLFQACHQKLQTIYRAIGSTDRFQGKVVSSPEKNASHDDENSQAPSSSKSASAGTPKTQTNVAEKCVRKRVPLSTEETGMSNETPSASHAHDPPFTSDLLTIFKCSICSTTFQSFDMLKSHAKNKHWIIKSEAECEHSEVETELPIVECIVQVTYGSRDEERELEQYLENDQSDDQSTVSSTSSFSFSDSGSDIRRNFPALRKIVKRLRSHGNEVSEDEETALSPAKISKPCRMKRKKIPPKQNLVKEKPKKITERSIKCQTCSEQFTASTFTEAETQLFKHLTENSLHDGKSIWKHVCKTCGKLFRFRSLLDNHNLKVHAHREKRKKCFSCGHCQSKFFTEKKLTVHFQKEHPSEIKTADVRNGQIGGDESVRDEENVGNISLACAVPKFEAIVIAHE